LRHESGRSIVVGDGVLVHLEVFPMRLAAFGFFFCASTMALCQSGPAAPAACDKTPLLSVPQVQDLKSLSEWRSQRQGCSNLQPARGVSVSITQLGSVQPQSDAMVRRPLNREALDVKMIIHPPALSLGVQPKGVPVEQNMYPGLKMQPVGQTNIAQLQVSPAPWPLLQIKAISVTWPQLRMIPVQKANSAVSATPAK
jgi:hypothetical protein